MIQEDLITSSFSKILGWSIIIQLYAKFIMGDILAVLMLTKTHFVEEVQIIQPNPTKSWLTLQYLQTLARKNLCVPATSTQAGWDGCPLIVIARQPKFQRLRALVVTQLVWESRAIKR